MSYGQKTRPRRCLESELIAAGEITVRQPQVSEFLHAIFTHGSLELFIFRKAFVDFSQSLVTDQEKVGTAVASIDLLEHSPVRTGHALLITV